MFVSVFATRRSIVAKAVCISRVPPPTRRLPVSSWRVSVCRGCSFVHKARAVEEAGGTAVLIADDAADNDSQFLDMITDGSTAKPSIPALFLLGRDG